MTALEGLPDRVGELGTQVAALTTRVDTLTTRVDSLTTRVETLTTHVDERFTAVDKQFEELRQEMRVLNQQTIDMLSNKLETSEGETRRLMRVLHEDVVSRFALLHDAKPGVSGRSRKTRKTR